MNILNKHMYEYFSKWYHVAIREMLFYYPFKDNVRDLAKQLFPPITEKEAKESIALQERLEIIKRTETGYKQTDSTITTGDETIQDLQLVNFQSEMMDHAKKALDLVPANQRDISSLSLSLSENGFKNAKKILQNTRKELLKEAQTDLNEDRVYQINFQLFPLSKKFTGGHNV
jgi:uncharacterized protein (TIGR02147 family)